MPDSAEYASLNTVKKLETDLVSIHELNARIASLVRKYNATRATDDDARKEIARAHQQTALSATLRRE